MRASLTEDVPFGDMLTRTVDDFESRSGLRVEFSMSTGIPSNLAPRVQVELAAHRQRGAHQRAQARRRHDGRASAPRSARGELVVTITDNGRGFAQEEAFDQGMGLRGMRERARLIGGSLLVMSELSGGTTIEARAPLVTRGLATLTEADERTPMVPETEPGSADLQLELPGVFPDRAVSGASVLAPGRAGANTADPNAPGVQP